MRTMTKEQTCGTCLFCQRNSRSVGKGACHYDPPTALALPMQGPMNTMGIQQIAFYPPVTLSDRGCGVYQAAFQLEGGDRKDE